MISTMLALQTVRAAGLNAVDFLVSVNAIGGMYDRDEVEDWILARL